MSIIRTLIVANGVPFPPQSGAPLRVWQHINVLATRGPVYVFSVGGPREATAMPVAAGWTHVDETAFRRRRGPVALIARALLARQYPVPSAFANGPINRELRDVLRRFRPDVVVLSHWKNACPAPLRGRHLILDMHNVESLLATDERAIRPPLLRAAIMWRSRRRERTTARLAKRIWVCGPNDARLLRELDPGLPAPVVVPNAVDIDRYARVRAHTVAPPPELRLNVPTIVFTGLFSYPPNAAAARELIETIFPAVRRRVTSARLVLVGADPTDAMRAAAARDPAIVVTGEVDDLEPYLAAATISVMPLYDGGGTRLKILESFAARIPVVATTKAAEGISAVDGRDIALAEDPRTLAELAVALLTDDKGRAGQAAAAYALVHSAYSWTSLSRSLDSHALGSAVRAVPEHRRSDDAHDAVRAR